MPRKSRIIVNNWSAMPDDLAVFYVSQAVKLGRDNSGAFPSAEFRRPSNGHRVFVAAFLNKSSDSFDVREMNDSGQYTEPTPVESGHGQ